MSDFEFTNNWFEQSSRARWDLLFTELKIKRVLEVGAYEGAGTCYLINKLAKAGGGEIYTVDTWGGGKEHLKSGIDMSAVEGRFRQNISRAVTKAGPDVKLVTLKGPSDFMLSALVAQQKAGYFDFAYIDGSHMASDVLCDAVLGFKLLKIGGVIGFDDYGWMEQPPSVRNPLLSPKLAIDSFINININKVTLLQSSPSQVYAQKASD